MITDKQTGETIALVETYSDLAAAESTVTDTLAMSMATGTPAFRVCVVLDPGIPENLAYRIRRIWPSPDAEWLFLAPEEQALYMRKGAGHVH